MDWNSTPLVSSKTAPAEICSPSFCLYWVCCNIMSVHVLIFWPWGMWSLTSLTRDWTYTSCVGGRSLNQWTIREIPAVSSIISVFFIVLNHVQPCVNILWSFPELSLNKTVFQQGVSLELLQFFFSWWQSISKSLPCFSVSFSFPSFFNWLQSGFTSHFPQTSLNSSRATVNFLPNQNVNSVSYLIQLFQRQVSKTDHYSFLETLFLLTFMIFTQL